jgi:thymidylate synthase
MSGFGEGEKMFQVFSGRTADEVYRQMASALVDRKQARAQGSRAGRTREILHVALSIEDPRQRWVLCRNPPLNPAFAIAEVVGIMAGDRESTVLRYFNKDLGKFVGAARFLHGAYGHRLRVNLGVDQVARAYEALKHNRDSRQVVLQVWDGRLDLPNHRGRPADRDIPCNIVSLLKVRKGTLEWLQVIRSNDAFLGVPYNLVQFTTLQEILAGWLGLRVGTYNQVSDSLHVYKVHLPNLRNTASVGGARNTDSLALPRRRGEAVLREMARRTRRLVAKRLTRSEFMDLASWNAAPRAYVNLYMVLCAYVARRRGWARASKNCAEACSNPALRTAWDNWVAARVERD